MDSGGPEERDMLDLHPSSHTLFVWVELGRPAKLGTKETGRLSGRECSDTRTRLIMVF